MGRQERWADVVGYEGLYRVSSTGRVRSLDRVVPHPRLGHQRVKGRLMKVRPDQDGYDRVQLCKLGKIKVWGVHQLVALAFVRNPDPSTKTTVNHKDGNKSNNRRRNLEWATRRENEDHATINGLKARGERNCNAKLTDDDVVAIRSRIRGARIRGVQVGDGSGDTIKRIASDYGVSSVTIYDIWENKKWGHVVA